MCLSLNFRNIFGENTNNLEKFNNKFSTYTQWQMQNLHLIIILILITGQIGGTTWIVKSDKRSTIS